MKFGFGPFFCGVSYVPSTLERKTAEDESMTQKVFSVTNPIRIIFAASIFIFIINVLLPAEEVGDNSPVVLRYIHTEGEILRADALVREQIFIDGYYSHDAEISESSLSRTLEVFADGSADLESEFITDEQIVGNPGYREWMSSESVVLHRNQRGELEVPTSASRPVLRNIPVFPVETLIPGDSWTAAAEEVHVFRIGGELWGPYRGELLASYIYEGNELKDGLRLARIRIDYDLYLPIRKGAEPVKLVSGTSSQLLYWDIEAGQPYQKKETFEFLLLMSNSQSQEIIGAQTVEYRRSLPLDRARIVAEIEDEFSGQDSLRVETVDDGILLTIDESNRILFDPESAVVSEDQYVGLSVIADILSDYEERDVLISGHTANYGSVEGRKSLSLDRAAAVANILYPEGRTGSGNLYIRGMGAEIPVGSDRQNRRVEILILD